jgi:hypothetical protein
MDRKLPGFTGESHKREAQDGYEGAEKQIDIMAELKELAMYGIIAAIVVAIVVILLSGSIFKTAYSINVRISQIGGNATYPYQTSHYIINITNNGGAPISNLLIGIYLGGVQQNTTKISIPAHQSITFLKNYTYTSPGTYEFEAVADPGHILNLANRTAAQSTAITNIVPPSLPNVYTSIPNSNITSTQSFTLDNDGIIASSAMAQRYNISIVNKFFGPADNISTKIFENGYPFIANVYGAYVKYDDNSIAYTAWLQGTINPQIVGIVISSFGPNVRKINESTGTVGYAIVANATSMCIFYSEGWTKIISYYNNSNPATCATFAANVYLANESITLINNVGNNPNLTHYKSGFLYTNSSILGSALAYDSYNLTATNIFSNNYGIFVSSIKRRGSPINLSNISNSTCYGLIANLNGTNVCSYVIPTRQGNYSMPYGLVNSSYITGNYIINMYSLVNNTELIAAHSNAQNLMGRLGINESSLAWNPVYPDSCAFENQSIGCTLDTIQRSNYTAYFNITNRLPKSIRINTLNCEMLPGFQNVTINATIAPNSSMGFAQKCHIVAAPQSSLVTSFMLLLNYTYNNSAMILNGTLNASNQYSN